MSELPRCVLNFTGTCAEFVGWLQDHDDQDYWDGFARIHGLDDDLTYTWQLAAAPKIRRP